MILMVANQIEVAVILLVDELARSKRTKSVTGSCVGEIYEQLCFFRSSG